jgi:hypothetical protein
MKGFEQEEAGGKLVYEIEIMSGQGKLDVELTPDGKIVTEEQTIPPADLPKVVKASLASSKYKAWTIKGAERVVKDEKSDQPAYEVVVINKDQKMEVVFDKLGKLTQEEKKSPKDND